MWPDYSLPPINLYNIGRAVMSKKGMYLVISFRGYELPITVLDADEQEWEPDSGNKLLDELLYNHSDEIWEGIERAARTEMDDYADHLTDCKRDEERIND